MLVFGHFRWVRIDGQLSCFRKIYLLPLRLGVSVKMNVLLFLPGLILCLSKSEGIIKAGWCLILGVGVQGLIGAPFLTEYAREYLNKAFEFDR
jgi:uncharacterized membrane protein